jgi:tetratricopeptide (TPR) repeat protein
MVRSVAAVAICAAFGLTLASPSGASPGAYSLEAAAGSSPRPLECLEPSNAQRHDTLWDRAKNPRLSRYCILLARGYAKLSSEPGASATLAAQAQKLLGGLTAPLVLKARAALALGDPKGAFAAFEEARTLDETLRLPPAALHDYALAAADSQHGQQALSAYRRLVPMAGLLTNPGHKERVYIEAALLVMVLEPGSVQEAAAYLLEARRGNPVPSLKPFILGGLALALDRQGRREEARGVAGEVRGAGALTRRLLLAQEGAARVTGPGGLRIFGHELVAMVAIVAAPEDRELSRQHWQQYIQNVGPDGAWVEHARAHLARTGGRR